MLGGDESPALAPAAIDVRVSAQPLDNESRARHGGNFLGVGAKPGNDASGSPVRGDARAVLGGDESTELATAAVDVRVSDQPLDDESPAPHGGNFPGVGATPGNDASGSPV